MKKMLLLYNPAAGDGRIAGSLSQIVDEMTKKGWLVTVYPTQSRKDGQRFMASLDGSYERVVVCGGDGMFHEALNGWMESQSKPLLGYIPSGTVNDFANSHDLPRDLITAADIAAGHWQTTLDVGQFNDEYFSYVAAFGIGTQVSYQTPQDKKKRLGHLAYVLEALNSVDFTRWENNCETMKITWPGGMCEGDFLYGMVSNSKYVAGTDLFTKDLFNWHDGLLEGLFVRRPMNLTELNQIIGCLTHSQFDNPLIVQVQAPWFEFETRTCAWTLDGEYGGVHDHVRTEAVPNALHMVLPASQVLETAQVKKLEESGHE